VKFHDELINFFKRHNLYDEEMFNYFSENSSMIDYRDEEQHPYIGTFYLTDKSKKINKIHLNIPCIYDDVTMLICIHEIVHAILLYKSLNKKISLGVDCESLPMLYEKIYINEKNTSELIEHGKRLDSLINKRDERYVFALSIRDELIDNYDYNIDKMDVLVKKKVKRLKKF